ncbi:MAG: hypothetical protein ACOZAM_15625 [Pseudomonadota bacterium]
MMTVTPEQAQADVEINDNVGERRMVGTELPPATGRHSRLGAA